MAAAFGWWGGTDGKKTWHGDVWRSADGVSWVSVPVSGSGFGRRVGHQVVSHEGSLWVAGGIDGTDYRDDVWSSADGASWRREANGAFLRRHGHQLVSHGGDALDGRGVGFYFQ